MLGDFGVEEWRDTSKPFLAGKFTAGFGAHRVNRFSCCRDGRRGLPPPVAAAASGGPQQRPQTVPGAGRCVSARGPARPGQMIEIAGPPPPLLTPLGCDRLHPTADYPNLII